MDSRRLLKPHSVDLPRKQQDEPSGPRRRAKLSTPWCHMKVAVLTFKQQPHPRFVWRQGGNLVAACTSRAAKLMRLTFVKTSSKQLNTPAFASTLPMYSGLHTFLTVVWLDLTAAQLAGPLGISFARNVRLLSLSPAPHEVTSCLSRRSSCRPAT